MKRINYTAEQTVDIVQKYFDKPTKETIEELAKIHGKSVKSIIAKLSREGAYKKAEYVSKSGQKPVSKAEIIKEIAKYCDCHEDVISSLDSATKETLTRIKVAFADLSEQIQELMESKTSN